MICCFSFLCFHRAGLFNHSGVPCGWLQGDRCDRLASDGTWPTCSGYSCALESLVDFVGHCAQGIGDGATISFSSTKGSAGSVC